MILTRKFNKQLRFFEKKYCISMGFIFQLRDGSYKYINNDTSIDFTELDELFDTFCLMQKTDTIMKELLYNTCKQL